MGVSRNEEPDHMFRMPGDGDIDFAADDDGVVHDVNYTRRSYAFACRQFVKVYDRDSDDFEEVIYFTYAQAQTLETSGPATCLNCIAGNNLLVR